MSTPEERLQESLAEFYALLDSMRFTGASQVVEVQHLKVLISKYPDQARFFVAHLNETGARTVSPDSSRRSHAGREAGER